MRLLVLGGTVFLGRHLVQQALERGWVVTLFNRGQTNPDLFPGVERLVGDRLAGDVGALSGGTWDACIDTSGYVPRVVREASEVLRERVGHYQFVSSISVYADLGTRNQDEDAPVGVLEDPTTEAITGETYGPLKILCEQETQHAWGDRGLNVRPGLIIGPDDKTDRFTYWPVRMAEGGDVLVPDASQQPVQAIDVRDLSRFMLDLTERRVTGVFNATGPAHPWNLGTVLDTVRNQTGSRADLVAAPVELLEEQEVAPWMGLPLWLPSDSWGMSQIDISRAVAAGLTLRTLEETTRDTLAWWRSIDPARDLRAGISRSKEAEVLALLAGMKR